MRVPSALTAPLSPLVLSDRAIPGLSPQIINNIEDCVSRSRDEDRRHQYSLKLSRAGRVRFGKSESTPSISLSTPSTHHALLESALDRPHRQQLPDF
ncbi:hypothetical protein VTJ04DRAFT_7220 [Mycothermus thermophilus]|uniref:uncharacterized protein n=1 Tax=Humicola insolens TaxID=85995 RepID=UPI00374232BF